MVSRCLPDFHPRTERAGLRSPSGSFSPTLGSIVASLKRTLNLIAMKTDTSTQNHKSPRPFGLAPRQWRRWIVRIFMIAVLFVALISAFSFLGVIVEKFFVTLYVD